VNENELMKPNIIVYRCSLVTAILLIIAAALRGFSTNNLIIAASTGDISKHYATSVLIDWILSSMLLFLVAVWLLFLAGELKKYKSKAWMQAFLIGLALTLFGAALWYRYPDSIHLPVFLANGLILLIPLIIYGRKFKE